MNSNSLVYEKSFRFAIDIINLYKKLVANNKEYILSKQLLRSGTSIGANIKESKNAQSTKDFISKLNIALKEADESIYWIELLTETKYIEPEEGQIMCKKCVEIIKMLTSIIKTTKNNLDIKEN